MKLSNISIVALVAFASCGTSCEEESSSVNEKDTEHVDQQQSQYAIGQPIPTYDFSLERQLVIELYEVRNRKAATHSVWRSDYGTIEGDCPSHGYGIPYDTSLTNPLRNERGIRHGNIAMSAVEQPEPNGVFASKNTSATWVLCLGESGALEPIYVESKVTVYPGPVKVDYTTNQVTRSGAANVLIRSSKVR